MEMTWPVLFIVANSTCLICFFLWLYGKSAENESAVVGPSYWGCYERGTRKELVPLRTIPVPVKLDDSASYDRAIGMF